jgi:Holliday junction DNA helicase RuvA
MIGYLRGQILENSEGRLLLLAGGAAGGVGYALQVPQSPEYDALLPGETVELFVHTHVREDALDLFGFRLRDEKELFLTLLTVNGIGPKGAMGILSNAGAATLIEAVLGGDKETLTRIPGIGKKTSERVVLELGDVLRKKCDAGVFRGILGSAERRPGGAVPSRAASRLGAHGANPVIRDAVSALVGLGYREQDVEELIARMIQDAKAPPTKAEELVRTALRSLG